MGQRPVVAIAQVLELLAGRLQHLLIDGVVPDLVEIALQGHDHHDQDDHAADAERPDLGGLRVAVIEALAGFVMRANSVLLDVVEALTGFASSADRVVAHACLMRSQTAGSAPDADRPPGPFCAAGSGSRTGARKCLRWPPASRNPAN